MSSMQVNVKRNAAWAVVVNVLQIIAVLSVTALIFWERGGLAAWGLLAASLIVSLGAVIDIREARAAVRKADEAETLSNMVAQMDELNRALRAQRHDFLNHLQVVSSLIEMQEYAEAGDYIDRVSGDIRQVSRFMRTDHPAINALLRAKLSDCEKAGILTEVTASGSWQTLPLPAWEFCRVLSNLIDNAIDAMKETANSHLHITLQQDRRGCFFSVSNNGPCIPASLLPRIFEAGISSHGEGRGMGLFIVKSTLEKYGGTVLVSSNENRTVFSGTLPCAGGKENHA